MNTNNNTNNNIKNNNSNNNNNNSNNNFGLGWMSSISDQFSQIKDVMTSETGGYEEYDNEEDEEIFMLRTEVLKYKEEVSNLEKKIGEFEEREVNISKEYSLILKEKNNEINELKSINDNLKSSLISPTTTSNIKEEQEEKPKIDSESIGIPLEDDDYNNITTNNNKSKDTHQDDAFLLEQINKHKEDYQNQISSLQELHQEKLYSLTQKNEQLEEKLLSLEELNSKLENEQTQLKTMIDNLKNQNNNYTQNIKELNENIESLKIQPTTSNDQSKKDDTSADSEQINILKEQINKSNKELSRLRQHLIDMEEQHTTIDLENEEKISNLEKELKKSMEHNINSSLMNDQINKLKNDAIEKDELIRQAHVQINNLNNVLEQFQAEQEAVIRTEVIHLEEKLKESLSEIEDLKKDKEEYILLQKKYQDAQSQIQILYQDIQNKTLEYIKLKEDIEPLKAAFDKNILRLGDMCLQEQESVDKRVVSKLLLNYFRGNKKAEILELIAKILNFSESEKISIGLTKRNQWSLIPPFFGGNKEQAGEDGDKPLAEMWIEFLLKEASGENLKNQNPVNTVEINNNEVNTTTLPPNNINNSSNSNPTPFSTPVKQPPPNFSSQVPPSSPSTPYKMNSNYFSVTPNGKNKTSTVIFDGDMNDPFK
ncbi:hypothetical protein DICPUDRAFT_98533 [Dictyostelium purpureum]|uniref:GRIP domain-containing protein n=1 Tax=Dictyostelium purpureum TaxID=5786 RepID=F0ZR90_DICPU|nr:uncharacterized protein DICPUDRAFT_98533 [Dictyostelium purpureum]EGC33555.1 hypothetical protein DICPUDRAFT_98533 [Dictyostelium purpureum]|eukprot:XP_003289937.1 hypothetical protein DICPUDRAFT_98533 [Dictyostelium purpureum]